MKIEKNTAVTLRIRMLQVGGKPGPANSDNIAYLHGGYDNIFAKLEGFYQRAYGNVDHVEFPRKSVWICAQIPTAA